MSRVHEAIGFVIVIGFGALFLWGIGSFIVRREPNQWFWRLLAFLQVTLIVQLIAGTTLLILGYRRVLLHYFYGSLFPAVVLVIAHVLARGMDDEKDTWKVFAVAAFFLFGLTLRALTTGLGMA
ncbi:MAG TPA: hypothetical protein DIU14_09480 [Actinobacteria bacterium]|nr:hypothetical protein [Actinomycetota bacterium]